MNTYEIKNSTHKLEMDYISNFFPSGIYSLHNIADEFHKTVDIINMMFVENPQSSKIFDYHLEHRDGRTYDTKVYLDDITPSVAFQNSSDKWKVDELRTNSTLFDKLIELVFSMGMTRIEIIWY